MKIATRVPPVPMVNAVQRFRQQLLRLHQSLAPAPAVMAELVSGAWVAQAIAVAAELRIADALDGGPLGLDQLAARVGAEQDALGRLLRALIGRGIFCRHRDGRYGLTSLAGTLRWDARDSVAGMARMVGTPEMREHWSHCVDAVRTGEAVVPKLRGMDGFEWLSGHPELSAVFDAAMTNVSEMAVDAVIAAYDFAGYRTIVDVAGGHGRLLAGILAKNPTTTGILFDLPHVVAGAEPLLSRHCVAERVRIIEGSFFEAVPDDGDLYVLKNIIHDWPDDQAQQILKTLRAATHTGTTVLLVECVIPPHDRDALAKWTDLEMLVMNAGRERTRDEYRDLLQQSGFQMTQIVSTPSPFSIVEATAG
ncbi:hydroxyneurosporene methyltransferase [Mycobacterium ahvazicum]|uniref:Hydroxyneurosporene methyltransferase n=1 Tax=Mycobacterium ahvazicum TaxID=1964395 RepID=A0A2K4YAK8_9MYCO|nr:methyltransferase [Mycobacterium ahvazicum]SOX53777.1 hydroxyneurosporene methyltransferase [Mycobacterium ahvazicum]